jgi:hypothetical protein
VRGEFANHFMVPTRSATLAIQGRISSPKGLVIGIAEMGLFAYPRKRVQSRIFG